MEARLGHDFSRVRIHSDEQAAESARAVNARAYAVGNHIVMGPGLRAAAARERAAVMHHELVHVMQAGQRAIPDQLPVARATDAAEHQASGLVANRTRRSVTQAEPVALRRLPGRSEHDVDGLPKASRPLGGWSSEFGGTRIKHDRLAMTPEELKEIFPQLARDAAASPPRVTEEQIATYADELSRAFQLMRIDTVEAQASYLGHATVESDQFRRFTETQGYKQWYAQDPTAIRLDTGWLNAAGENPRYPSYKMGGTINPASDKSWQSSYIGRGPVQVTHTHNYREVLKKMEQTADEYEIAGETTNASRLREAVAAIRADPRMAADPRYTFLFSAAYQKWSGGDVSVADVERDKATYSGTGTESIWVTGGAKEDPSKAAKKKEGWRRAYDVLMRKADIADKDPATYSGPASGPGHHIPA
jgi:predicted chitinase